MCDIKECVKGDTVEKISTGKSKPKCQKRLYLCMSGLGLFPPELHFYALQKKTVVAEPVVCTLRKHLSKCSIKVQPLCAPGKQCFMLYMYFLKSLKMLVFWSTSTEWVIMFLLVCCRGTRRSGFLTH